MPNQTSKLTQTLECVHLCTMLIHIWPYFRPFKCLPTVKVVAPSQLLVPWCTWAFGVGLRKHMIQTGHRLSPHHKYHISKHPTAGSEHFQQPLSMMRWQNTRWVWTTVCARCLIASDCLAMGNILPASPCSFWRIPRPDLSHTWCHGFCPCITCISRGWRFRQFVMCFLQLSYWCLMSIYQHRWENMCLRQGTSLSNPWSLVPGRKTNVARKKTSQEEDLESLSYISGYFLMPFSFHGCILSN